MDTLSLVDSSAILKRHMRREKLSQQDIADLTGLGHGTIQSFIRGLRQPHFRTSETIFKYLKDVGEVTDRGLPVEPLQEEDFFVANKDQQQLPEAPEMTADEIELNKIGIKQQPIDEKRLTEFDKRLLIYSVYNTNASQEEKDNLLNKII